MTAPRHHSGSASAERRGAARGRRAGAATQCVQRSTSAGSVTHPCRWRVDGDRPRPATALRRQQPQVHADRSMQEFDSKICRDLDNASVAGPAPTAPAGQAAGDGSRGRAADDELGLEEQLVVGDRACRRSGATSSSMTMRPIGSIGWRTVVSGGSVQFMSAESSKPTTETSVGHARARPGARPGSRRGPAGRWRRRCR